MAWLRRGLSAGACLACAECVLAAAAGRHVPAAYLFAIAVFDCAGGIVIGIVAIALATVLHRRTDATFAGLFIPLGAATSFVYLFDKSLVAAAFHDVPRSLAVGVLVLATVVSAATAYRLCRGRTSVAARSFLVDVGVLPLVFFLVGGRHLTRSVFGSYLRPGAALTNLALAAAAVGATAALYRLLSRRPSRSAAVVLFCALGLAAGATVVFTWTSRPRSTAIPPPNPGAKASTGRPNIILISIDTLRADRLSCYGYARRTSPAMDRLAAQSLLFRNAISPGNWTGPGHASMLTGTLPTTNGVRQYENGLLGSETLTLAEILRDAGYQTGAVVSNATVLSRSKGFAQGFQFYDARMERAFGYEPLLDGPLAWFPLLSGQLLKPNRTASDVNRTALAWVELNRASPFFLFINYMDVHAPCAPPDEFGDRFPGRQVLRFSSPAWDLFRASRDITLEEDAHYRALYDGEIAYVDQGVGRLLDGLGRLGVFDRSLLVVTSDHGEFFGEHRLWGHAVGPYQPVHHVPLIVKYPGGSHRGVSWDWVSLIDIVPTALRAVGLYAPPGIQGTDLTAGAHPVFIEGAPNIGLTRQFGSRFSRSYRGLYEGPWKLVEYSDTSVKLFNLLKDPHEQRDLAASDAEQVGRLTRRLERYWASLPTAPASQVRTPPRGDDFRALGYVE
jgi:arylsulfatase A-like enzyme